MTAPTLDEARDDAHLIPIADWEKVVQAAEAHASGDVPAEKLHGPRGLSRSSFPSVTGVVTAKYGGGQQPVKFGVLHDAETPLANGYAASIANYFAGNPPETSAHFMLGPDATYQMRDTNLLAWHCGNGNRYSIGVEQAGYARFSRAEWLTDAGVAQMHRLASLMHEIQAAHGIGTYFMSDQQLRDAYAGKIVGGWATHAQCSRVLGGSSHSDPLPNYPLDELGAMLGGAPAPAPAPAPAAAAPPTFGWNLPRGHYYGNIAGPAASHGGYTAAERQWVKIIQQWFIYLGCVPGQTNPNSGWADGKWEDATDTACIRWHARFYPNQPQPKQLWADDLARLFASRP